LTIDVVVLAVAEITSPVRLVVGVVAVDKLVPLLGITMFNKLISFAGVLVDLFVVEDFNVVEEAAFDGCPGLDGLRHEQALRMRDAAYIGQNSEAME
jgi:hypothetical protein